MGNSDSAKPLAQFLGSADALSNNLTGHAEVIPSRVLTTLSPSEHKKLVDAALADATPEFRALVNRLGVKEYSFLGKVSVTKGILGSSGQSPFISFVAGDAGNELDGKLAVLKSRLEDINAHLAQVAKDATTDFEARSTTASSDFKAAIEKLDPLAFFIRGDYIYSAGDAGKAEALVTELSKALETASTSANATLDIMRHYEAAVSLDHLLPCRHLMRSAVRTNSRRRSSWYGARSGSRYQQVQDRNRFPDRTDQPTARRLKSDVRD